MSAPSAVPAGKFLILVIEDDPTTARLLAVHLARSGLECHHAANGKSGLAAFDSIKPHLVLLDIMMPDMDGHEVCARIRASSTVPIIMITARTESADQVQSFKSGADDYVAKPFDLALLMARVMAHLRRAYRYDAPGQKMGWPKTAYPLEDHDDAALAAVTAPEAQPLFSPAREPYTLADIAAVLNIPYKRVQHSRRVLERRASTRAKVLPLDRGRPLHFSAAAADLIARHCRPPKRS